jgi:hypothetical protein
MIAYKVLKICECTGTLCSLNAYRSYDNRLIGSSLSYELNIWIHPYIVGSSLYVFRTRNDAYKFIQSLYSFGGKQVWKCEIKNPGYPKFVAKPSCDVRYFWKQKVKHIKLERHLVKEAPKGTVTCSRLKLIERV